MTTPVTTLDHDAVLRLISREGPITRSEVMARLALSEDNARLQINRLHREGMICPTGRTWECTKIGDAAANYKSPSPRGIGTDE